MSCNNPDIYSSNSKRVTVRGTLEGLRWSISIKLLITHCCVCLSQHKEKKEKKNRQYIDVCIRLYGVSQRSFRFFVYIDFAFNFLPSLSATWGQIFTLSFCTSEAFKLSLLCIDSLYTSKQSTAIPSVLWGCTLSEWCSELKAVLRKTYSVFSCVRSKCGSIVDNKAHFKQHCDVNLSNLCTSIFSDLPSCCSNWNFSRNRKIPFFLIIPTPHERSISLDVLVTFAN